MSHIYSTVIYIFPENRRIAVAIFLVEIILAKRINLFVLKFDSCCDINIFSVHRTSNLMTWKIGYSWGILMNT